MISGLEKEFELTAAEIEDFINSYNNRADGNHSPLEKIM
ncbi:hypothetical protein EMIT07CA2_40569 [Brevibacillus sp. IT-7CA2]